MEYHLPIGYITTDTFSDEERGQIAQAWSEMQEGYTAYKDTMSFPEFAQQYLKMRLSIAQSRDLPLRRNHTDSF